MENTFQKANFSLAKDCALKSDMLEMFWSSMKPIFVRNTFFPQGPPALGAFETLDSDQPKNKIIYGASFQF